MIESGGWWGGGGVTLQLLTQVCSEKVSKSRNRHCEWQAKELEDKTERLNSVTYRAVEESKSTVSL